MLQDIFASRKATSDILILEKGGTQLLGVVTKKGQTINKHSKQTCTMYVQKKLLN